MLPNYSSGLLHGETMLQNTYTLEGLEDEGIGEMYNHGPLSFAHDPQWSFDHLTSGGVQSQMTAVPPGSDNYDEEGLFEGASDKAQSSGGLRIQKIVWPTS